MKTINSSAGLAPSPIRLHRAAGKSPTAMLNPRSLLRWGSWMGGAGREEVSGALILPGIPMAHGEWGWRAFKENQLSPQTCQVSVSSSRDLQEMGIDPAQNCGSALLAASQCGVASLCTILSVQSTSQSRVAAVHPQGTEPLSGFSLGKGHLQGIELVSEVTHPQYQTPQGWLLLASDSSTSSAGSW